MRTTALGRTSMPPAVSLAASPAVVRSPDSVSLYRRRLGASIAQQIVIAPSGVWVLASRYAPPRHGAQAGLLGRRTDVVQLGRRETTRMVANVRRQAELIRAELDGATPVAAMLCILDADWPIFGGAFTVDGVRVLWPSKAQQVIAASSTLASDEVARIAEQLSLALPEASRRCR